MNKEYELCPVSVIGCLLAVKRRADYEDVHAAVGRCDEEEQAGLHEVWHLSRERRCDQD